MGGQGRQIGGLALCVMGILGVCLACGLPMWRETSFVGANIVTAQSVSQYTSKRKSLFSVYVKLYTFPITLASRSTMLYIHLTTTPYRLPEIT